MLKGTTRIELTDVNTGEVETYQNSNMVTKCTEGYPETAWTFQETEQVFE